MPEPIFEERFENPSPTGLPEGWTGSGRIVPEAFEGNGALLVTDDSTTTYELVSSHRFAIAAGTYCELSAQVRTDVVDPGGALLRIRVEEYDGPPDEPAASRITARWFNCARTTDWQANAFTFTTTSATASILLVFYPAHNAGVDKTASAWFDGVRLEQRPEPAPTVIDGWGKPVPVSGVEDVSEQLTPDQFWSRLPKVRVEERVRDRSLWSYPLFRRHYFGLDLGLPKRVWDYHSALPHFEKTLGVTVDIANPAVHNVIADDIRFQPIARAHPPTTGSYSKLYYPRRTVDWLGAEFLPAFAMTQDSRIRTRLAQLLDFLAFSQYDENGHNEFTATYFPDDHQKAKDRGWTKEWVGSWDYVYDWEWLDAYGYYWRLHSGDHHVCAAIAADLVQAYELTGRESDLEAARLFVQNMVPRYGWHTGSWRDRRYYWTEYNPAGPTNPHRDATDNVQALVARSVAAVGYYEKDPRKLEYARGLLWYMVREWTTDGRWYYDGAENPINERRAITHDMPCLMNSLSTAAYLTAAGVRLDEEFETLTKAYEFYLDNYQYKPMIWVKYGQLTKLAPRRVDDEWEFTSFFTANRSSSQIKVHDTVPSSAMDKPGKLQVRVSKLLPPQSNDDEWRVDKQSDRKIRATASQLRDGLSTGWTMRAGDVLRITYRLNTGDPWAGTAASLVSLTAPDGSTQQVTSWSPDKAFPGVATDENFPTIAARLIFPLCASRSQGFRA